MKNDSYLDVVIIGGGPAGSAAALTLLNQTSLKVGIIESTDYSNHRVGESVSPSILSLMRYLRIEKEFISDGHIHSYGIDTAWGSSSIRSRDFFFTGQGNGWNLDRKKFDKMMSEAVRKKNGTILTSTKVSTHKKINNKWILRTQGPEDNSSVITSDFVIDASGKGAAFARSLGTKWELFDYLVGIASVYEIKNPNEEPSYTLLESTPNGWWYSTLLPNNKRIVVFMTDRDIAKSIQIQKLKNWEQGIRKTLHIQQTIKNSQLIENPKIFPAYSQIIKSSNFSGWIPAGDAVASFDPLSSIGIGHAIVSGIEAARIAYNNTKSDGTLISRYMKKIFENFDQYLKNRRHFYSYEKRWSEEPFWKRRHFLKQKMVFHI